MRDRRARKQYDALAAAMKAAVGDLREAVAEVTGARASDAELDEARARIVGLMDALQVAESGWKWTEELCAEARKQLDIERAGTTIIVQERDKALFEVERLKGGLDNDIQRYVTRARNAEATRDGLTIEVDLANQRIRGLLDGIERKKAELADMTQQRDAMIAPGEKMRAEIERLKAAAKDPSGATSRATSPRGGEEKVMIGQVLTGQREKMRLTGLAERIHELASKGYSDRYICDLLNARKTPPEWLNAAGVAAIREMLG